MPQITVTVGRPRTEKNVHGARELWVFRDQDQEEAHREQPASESGWMVYQGSTWTSSPMDQDTISVLVRSTKIFRDFKTIFKRMNLDRGRWLTVLSNGRTRMGSLEPMLFTATLKRSWWFQTPFVSAPPMWKKMNKQVQLNVRIGGLKKHSFSQKST